LVGKEELGVVWEEGKGQREGETVEFLAIDFYQVGSHENFHDTLKRYLREG